MVVGGGLNENFMVAVNIKVSSWFCDDFVGERGGRPPVLVALPGWS